MPPPWPETAPGARIRAALASWTRSAPRPLVVFLDEIDALHDATLEAILRQLRSGFSSRPSDFPWSLALCGMRDVRDYKLASGGSPPRLGSSSPFNVKVESSRLGDFTLEEVRALYAQHTADTGQPFTDEALTTAFALSEGQPWLVNALAREVVDKMKIPAVEPITAAHIDQAKERLILARATHLDPFAARADGVGQRRVEVERAAHLVEVGDLQPRAAAHRARALPGAQDRELFGWLQALYPVWARLTPEMLPMIVTVNLAKGAIAMSRAKVIVKRLNAIQNFGAMDVLCTDKTGTLTQDKIFLERHTDVFGAEADEVLEYAYLNSHYQTGLKNLLDVAVLQHVDLHRELNVATDYAMVDEMPFDFSRRRMSVVVAERNRCHLLICKGAVEEVLRRSAARGIADPLMKFGLMPIVVATIGLSIATRNAMRAGYSAEAHPFPSLFADKIFNIAGVTVTLADVGTLVLALLIVFATQAFLAKTVTGRAMQAVAQNTESASVLGINVPRMITLTYGFGVGLAALGGVMAAPRDQGAPGARGREW